MCELQYIRSDALFMDLQNICTTKYNTNQSNCITLKNRMLMEVKRKCANMHAGIVIAESVELTHRYIILMMLVSGIENEKIMNSAALMLNNNWF